MFRDDHAERADERIGPERSRLCEDHAHGEVVDLLDLDVLVTADGGGGGVRVLGILVSEDDVVGRERLSVMPFDSPLKLPDDREAILFQAIVLLAWNLGSKRR